MASRVPTEGRARLDAFPFLKELEAALMAQARAQVKLDLKVAVLTGLEFGAGEIERRLGISRTERQEALERVRAAAEAFR